MRDKRTERLDRLAQAFDEYVESFVPDDPFQFEEESDCTEGKDHATRSPFFEEDDSFSEVDVICAKEEHPHTTELRHLLHYIRRHRIALQVLGRDGNTSHPVVRKNYRTLLRRFMRGLDERVGSQLDEFYPATDP